MNRIDWKSLLPIGAAIALFFALSLAYFSPVLEGTRLRQGDLKNWQGMAQEIMEHREAHEGEDPLWTGSMFSGMPAYQIAVAWPQNLLRFADKVFHGFLPRPASFLFLYLVGMYILLRCLRVDPWLCVAGAVAFAFSSYFFAILEAGHNSKANAIGYIPPVLGALFLLYRGRVQLGAVLLALFLGLEIAMNHVQVTYYFGILMALFVLAEGVSAVRGKRIADFLKRSAFGAAAGVIALLCNAGLLWTTYEYGKYTTRGPSELTISPSGSDAKARTGGLDRDYVTQWSYGKQESFSLLVPNVKGGASGSLIKTRDDFAAITDPALKAYVSGVYEQGGYVNDYWGDQTFTSGPVYIGAIVVLLMLLAMAQAEGYERWWALAAVVLIPLLLQIQQPLVAGLLVIAYLVAGLVLTRDTLRYALFSALLLALFLGWGHNYMPLTDFFLDHVPGYDKFRAVTIILVVIELAAPVLGILYLDRLLRDGGWDRAAEKRFLIPAGCLLVLLLAMAVMPGSLFDFLSDREREQFTAMADASEEGTAQLVAAADGLKELRMGVLSADAWRSVLFVIAAGGLLFAYGRRKMGRTALLVSLGALMLIDLWAVDKRYVNNEKEKGRYLQWEEEAASKLPFKPTASDMAVLEAEENAASKEDAARIIERLKADKKNASGRNRMLTNDEQVIARFAALRRNTHYRALWMRDPFNDSRMSYFHKSIGGYHGAKLKRYQELIEFELSREIGTLNGALRAGTDMQAMSDLLAGQHVINMLNTRYLVYDPAKPPIRNLHAMGPAWFVDEVKWVAGADEEITALADLDPARTALIDQRYKAELGEGAVAPDPSAEVTLDSYAANELHYTVRSANGGVVVFSEIWYGPDWTSTIDGATAEHVRADYVLRAMRVPAGEHKVAFRIESPAYNNSGVLMYASSALVLLLVLGTLWQEWKRGRAAA